MCTQTSLAGGPPGRTSCHERGRAITSRHDGSNGAARPGVRARCEGNLEETSARCALAPWRFVRPSSLAKRRGAFLSLAGHSSLSRNWKISKSATRWLASDRPRRPARHRRRLCSASPTPHDAVADARARVNSIRIADECCLGTAARPTHTSCA